MKAKKKYGWINQASNGQFVKGNADESRTIRLAEVYPTRYKARCGLKVSSDTVRKVELTRAGKAKRIIPGR